MFHVKWITRQAGENPINDNKKVVCNIGYPFIDCRRETNKSKIGNATDIDAVM